MNRATIGFLIMVLGTATVFLSDLLIRTATIPGADPHAYDIYGTVMLLLGGFMAVFGPTNKED